VTLRLSWSTTPGVETPIASGRSCLTLASSTTLRTIAVICWEVLRGLSFAVDSRSSQISSPKMFAAPTRTFAPPMSTPTTKPARLLTT
jgi:hypothetical protein